MNISKTDLIAVVGASNDESKYGHKIFRDLLNAGYNVIPINPKTDKILDKQAFPSLSELKEKPELVITVVPPQITEKIVQEVHNLGIKKIWMQPGSESKEVIDLADKLGLETTHNSCFMIKKGLW